jgi:serine/threonine protein kinase, bacterial
MNYCLNPACPNPENSTRAERCQACGSKLLLRDRYRISQVLWQANFGGIFLAQDLSLPGSPYCLIKQLRPAELSPHAVTAALHLFKREIQTLGKTGHLPGVPRLLDYFEVNQKFYIVQERLDGLTQQALENDALFSEIRRLSE